MNKELLDSIIIPTAFDIALEVFEGLLDSHVVTCANKAEALKVAETYNYRVELLGFFDSNPQYMN